MSKSVKNITLLKLLEIFPIVKICEKKSKKIHESFLNIIKPHSTFILIFITSFPRSIYKTWKIFVRLFLYYLPVESCMTKAKAFGYTQ